MPGAFAAPHDGHARASAVPHSPQNLRPGSFSTLQAGQRTLVTCSVSHVDGACEPERRANGTRSRPEVYEARVVSRPPIEDALVERARDGDSTAFTLLVRDHEEIAFRTAYLITRNAADAEDAAQVGLTKAWRALRRFRRGAPLRPWLLAIVANEARNRRRAEGRREGPLPPRRPRASLG